MTLVVFPTEYARLHQRITKQDCQNLALEEFETLYQKPQCLKQSGFTLRAELMPGVWLNILNWNYEDEMILKVPVHPHPIQLLILTAGFIDYEDVYPTFGGKQGYFSGSGISPSYTEKYRRAQHIAGINIQIDLERFQELFPDLLATQESFAQLLFKSNEFKTAFFPKVTPSIQTIAQQIINPPFRGVTKKIYLQGKVLELLAYQLEALANKPNSSTNFKSETVNRIQHAKAILDRSYHNPPSIIELAQTVAVSERTLQRGFRQLFNSTVIGYITYLRIQQAEQLLRSGDLSVAEVANLVGYSHLGHFAAAFKRQFGITPSECLAGKLGELHIDAPVAESEGFLS